MGLDASGKRLPNGIDYFWDGQGEGNCWDSAAADVVQPLTLPRCPATSPHRFLDDPNTLVLFVNCSSYDLASRTLPAGCDWFDTPARPGVLAASITIQSVLPAVQIIAVLLLFALLVRRRGRGGPLGLAAVLTAAAGSIVLLIASVEHFYYLAAAGIGLLGVGGLAAVRLVPTERLAVLTLILGIVALLEAVDSGILLLPSPVGLVWIRVLLEMVWVVWTAVALVRRTSPEPARAEPAKAEPEVAPATGESAATA